MKHSGKPKLLGRLNRIAGQVRGVARMIEDDRYCIDVLTQTRAIRAALVRVESELLKNHLGHCIESAIVSGNAKEQRRKSAELIALLEKGGAVTYLRHRAMIGMQACWVLCWVWAAGIMSPAVGQGMQDMPGMDMPGMDMPSGSPPPARPAGEEKPQDMQSMPGMNGQMMMGATGSYSMMRDASGTSWQPNSTPMEGLSSDWDGWSAMLHGYITGVYDHQGGPRGAEKTFGESMLMGMAQKSLGAGTLTLRTMLSLDPLMGKSGYPLLLQTGETANGVTPLVDRQHPHDLFMELAAIYSVPLSDTSSVFGYVGYPGEPALGPPAFMHRFSGMDDPAAPITHHWLDSTHITYGVLTGGFVTGDWKIEASAFRGREPDQFRWNFDPPSLDSAAVRLSWNPAPDWALQVSHGFLKSPEQLEPGVNQHRTTASAIYNRPFDHGNWQTTLAWGRNDNHPGNGLDAYLLESALSWNRHTLFARAENAAKDELFLPPSLFAGKIFRVSSFSLGYVYDIPVAEHLLFGLGAVGTIDAVPSAIGNSYGATPASYMLFSRLKIN